MSMHLLKPDPCAEGSKDSGERRNYSSNLPQERGLEWARMNVTMCGWNQNHASGIAPP
jgi:hypothetical protein